MAVQEGEVAEYGYIGIALHMPASVVDNTLQGKELAPFDIQILATQYTYETDALGSDYDENADLAGDEANTPDNDQNGQN